MWVRDPRHAQFALICRVLLLSAQLQRAGQLSAPLRDRFGVMLRLEMYDDDELCEIVKRSAGILNIKMDEQGVFEIASRSRGTPRIANRLLRRVRDYAQIKADGTVTRQVADMALKMLEVDSIGLDKIDKSLLLTVINNFGGGPVGLDTLAASIGEDANTIEDVYEPFLLRKGFISRTPRAEWQPTRRTDILILQRKDEFYEQQNYLHRP